MPTRTLKPIRIFAGLAIAVMIVTGILLTWGYSAVASQVHSELATQKIYFPPSNSPVITALPTADAIAMSKYAGQLLTTGPQAETYASSFEAAQINSVAGGQTLAQLASKPVAAGSSHKARLSVFIEQATLFRDQAIQGLLLDSYKYWKIGQIMLFGAIAAFAGAAVLLMLSAIGLARRVALEAESLLTSTTRPAVKTA